MRSLSSFKKGQLQSLSPAILALVFAAIILVFGLIITQELTSTADDSARTVRNETLSGVLNETPQALGANSLCNVNLCTGVRVTNATTGPGVDAILGAGNYSITNNDTCYIAYLGTGDTDFNNSAWNVTYTHNWGGQACIAGNKTVVGMGTFADFWQIIVLAVVISVVIGLLLIVFGGSAQRR